MISTPILKFENVSFSYPEGCKPEGSLLISPVSFDLQPGTFVSLLGRNGVGKTTLLKLMANLLQPVTGDRHLENVPFSRWSLQSFAKKVTYLPSSLDCLFPIQVKDLVMFGRAPYLKSFSVESKHDEDCGLKSLETTETLDLKDRYFQTLSSGEKQRVLLAKALAQTPKLLLIDEITAHLDPSYQQSLLKLLKQISQTQHIAIFMVSHNEELSQMFSDEIFVLKNDGLSIYDRMDHAI